MEVLYNGMQDIKAKKFMTHSKQTTSAIQKISLMFLMEPADFIHVVVVSRKFNGYTMMDRGDIIWDELLKHLSDEEWGHVSLLIGATPEEVQLW